jgi:serine/threonine protein kinase
MPLSSGAKLGAYSIVTQLGSGGMGEVYRARDTRLDRDVAIKVLPEHLATDDIARQRFEREAKAIAALNHPHICQVYDVGPNYLVMEYIEGEPLKGPLPLAKALEYAGQIASDLRKLHQRCVPDLR